MIALSLAAKFPEAEVHAVDVSDDALALAQENAENLGLTGRVQFAKSNLLENFSERFDLIVANLPYVSKQDRGSLSREVLRDPEIALFGGEQGDQLIRQLIERVPDHLQPAGLLAMEIGIGQGDTLSELLIRKNYRDIDLRKDYAGTPRFLLARYG